MGSIIDDYANAFGAAGAAIASGAGYANSDSYTSTFHKSLTVTEVNRLQQDMMLQYRRMEQERSRQWVGEWDYAKDTVKIKKAKPKTFREELQAEVSAWLS